MTQSSPDWACGVGGGPDIWYSYTTTGDDIVTVSTCGTAAYDTAIEIFSGDCANPQPAGVQRRRARLPGLHEHGGCTCRSHRHRSLHPHRRMERLGGHGYGRAHRGPGAPSVDNDDCGTAIALGLGETAFTSVGATDSGVDLSCVFNGELGDVWYSYTAIGDCPVTVDLTGSAYDTGLAVYSGDCAALTEVGCNDDFSGFRARSPSRRPLARPTTSRSAASTARPAKAPSPSPRASARSSASATPTPRASAPSRGPAAATWPRTTI